MKTMTVKITLTQTSNHSYTLNAPIEPGALGGPPCLHCTRGCRVLL